MLHSCNISNLFLKLSVCGVIMLGFNVSISTLMGVGPKGESFYLSGFLGLLRVTVCKQLFQNVFFRVHCYVPYVGCLVSLPD